MHRTAPHSRPPRPPRTAVLVVSHPDGHVEAFAEPHIDVRLCRVPVAHSREAEIVAEDLAELTLPRRYRDLWRRDRLRAVGTTRPLTADAMQAAMITRDVLSALTAMAEEREEAVTWTL